MWEGYSRLRANDNIWDMDICKYIGINNSYCPGRRRYQRDREKEEESSNRGLSVLSCGIRISFSR